MLTNGGGLFYGKGFAAEYDSLKPCLTLYRYTDVTLERGGSGTQLLFIIAIVNMILFLLLSLLFCCFVGINLLATAVSCTPVLGVGNMCFFYLVKV